MDNTELQHDGIKGMKWGLRRFQYKDGSLTPEGRKRYAKNKKSDDDKKKEIPKPKTKEEALKSGSAKELMEFKGEISADEYKKVFQRFKDEKELASYSKEEANAALQKFEDVMGKVERVRVGSEKAISAYNTIAKINNAFNPSFRFPEIKEGQINRFIKRAEERRDALETARRLDAAEKRYGTDGDRVFNNLTTDEVKEFKSRVNEKSQIKDRFNKQAKNQPNSKAGKKKDEEEPKKQKAEEKTDHQKVFDDADTTISGGNKGKTDNTSGKQSRKNDIYDDDFVDKSDSTTKRSGGVKGKKWGVRVRTSDQDKSQALALVNRTAASALALYNSGKSVAEIAKQYGISESAVYKMLEELK